MAIIEELGLEVKVQVDGSAGAEYTEEEPEIIEDACSKTTKACHRYVESVDNAEFAISPKNRAREARKAQARVDSAFRLVKSFSDAQHIGLRPRSRTLNETEYQDLLDRIGVEAQLDEHIWKRFR
jgi:gamma-glutamyl:cysteine ligase YbdK (ATP-grasp superfamily)